jgi:hypothetical protein
LFIAGDEDFRLGSLELVLDGLAWADAAGVRPGGKAAGARRRRP